MSGPSKTRDIEDQSLLDGIHGQGSNLWEECRGAVFMGLASYALSFMHLGTKLLSMDGMPVVQMILLRSLLLLILLYVACSLLRIPHGMSGPREMHGLLVGRALTGNIALVLFMASVTALPLGDSVALSFICPIMMIGLAPLMVGEPLFFIDGVTLAAGMVGVLLISRPAFLFGSDETGMTLGHVYGVLAAATNSVSNLLVRKIGNRAHMLHIVAHFTAFSVLPSLAWCLLNMDSFMYPITPVVAGKVVLMSIGALAGQFFFSYSLQIEKVAKVTPMIFLQVFFAFLNDWMLFQTIPSTWTVAGAACISISVIATNLFH
ncbi:hypothetical protein DSO57_1015006 [Entomophthora muscae]|uniref:Uncharacterized protein n=1 Tax=Entomophthora muscae TaxID=34485 RepID=A0ACC2RK64_9FUNG|nr:hypothetical protein DSO57_1015006 [Entomophthora muscae]